MEFDSPVPHSDENQDNEATETNPPLIEAVPAQLSYMSFSVPSFIKKSTLPTDRKANQEIEAPVPTPAKMAGASASVDRSTSSRKRDFQQTPGASHASGLISQNKLKQMTLKSPQSSVSVTSKSKFLESVNDNVSNNSVSEWDKMSLAEAAPMVTAASSQCLFFFLKYEGEIVEAARGDARAREEDQEKRGLVILKVDKARDDVDASYVKKVKELKAQVKAFKTSTSAPQENQSLDQYEAGYATRIKDYMASTYEVFPNLEWALLGQDAVDAVERIKKEKAVVADGRKAINSTDDAKDVKDKEVEDSEVKARVADATLEIPSVEPQSAVPSIDLDATSNPSGGDEPMVSPVKSIQ
ncbi:hypothetical protein POM88_029989 [Heracleum sosnowskyi]|uniref:Uncharacterized protein n=1 Tax=Heracleum sosnowskyi TaxID=360622 RepID=A0AAD8HW65_9APIA|nr:hypothetical protein POM88_029989 [Heracleum sosnowskyi]